MVVTVASLPCAVPSRSVLPKTWAQSCGHLHARIAVLKCRLQPYVRCISSRQAKLGKVTAAMVATSTRTATHTNSSTVGAASQHLRTRARRRHVRQVCSCLCLCQNSCHPAVSSEARFFTQCRARADPHDATDVMLHQPQQGVGFAWCTLHSTYTSLHVPRKAHQSALSTSLQAASHLCSTIVVHRDQYDLHEHCRGQR